MNPAARAVAIAALGLGLLGAGPGPAAARDDAEGYPARDRRLIDAMLERMPPQRAGHPDLYVVGFAGDGAEDVFRNEVRYLETMAGERLDARRRVIPLVNHPDSLEEGGAPLATLANLRLALAGVAGRMDPEEDLLLLFLTTHGTPEHELVASLAPVVEEALRPQDLRAALDDAGIRNRVVVVSACFSGGFLPKLQGPDTLVITAARRDRTSFGCGAASTVTWFGHAWLVEGLNRHASFVAAYDDATRQIARREIKEGYAPSLPQIAVGKRVAGVLQAWQSTLPPGPEVPYPFPVESTAAEADGRLPGPRSK
ncbi:C13 family peptidase [Luteimonas sp. RD2P54]|uniref:C13 family peptidase n=1 Tax=Luteimonas endophytica TaxID=3042023 RepID=A0ABT6J3Y4_9GAMM|nr:C13 family peptidase [Luteimonas endophytica]MDH5821532.1 C13 family peptidase [Luteimonas endophytica]